MIRKNFVKHTLLFILGHNFLCTLLMSQVHGPLSKKKILHTCEEGGIHLRVSLWHLLMNLKKNY